MINQNNDEVGYLIDTLYSTITVNTGDKNTRLLFAIKSMDKLSDDLIPVSSYSMTLHDVNSIDNLTNLALMIDKLVTPLLMGIALKNIQNKRSNDVRNR